jgi:PAS domain-containing protein
MGRHTYSISGNAVVSIALAAIGLAVGAGMLYLLLSLHGAHEEALVAEAALRQTSVVIGRGEALLRSTQAMANEEREAASRELHAGLEQMRLHAERHGAGGLLTELEQSADAWLQILRAGSAAASEASQARVRFERALQSLAWAASQHSLAKEHHGLAAVRSWQEVTLALGIGTAALLVLLALLFARKVSSAKAEASACCKVAEHERGRLEALLRRLPVPLLRTTGAEHRIVFANAPLRALCPDRKIVGEPLSALDPRLSAAWERVFTTGQSLADQQVSWRLQRDGVVEPVHLNLWLEPVRGEGGTVEGVLGIATDVTSLVEARGGAERLQALAASLSRSATATELAEGILAQCLEAFGAEDGLVALVSAQRSDLLPQVPTIAEAGLPGFEFTFWNGVCAPAGTPAAVTEKIARDLAQVITSAELRGRLTRLGAEPMTMMPDEFSSYVRREIENLERIARVAGIKAQ